MSGSAQGRVGELARFFAVALGGLVIDFAVALTLSEGFGVALPLAAAAGFLTAAGANYLAHELWTFRDGARQVSARRALRYGIALALTIAARVAVVAAAAASGIFGDASLPPLALGAVVSFVVNYLASRAFVFAPQGRPEESPET